MINDQISRGITRFRLALRPDFNGMKSPENIGNLEFFTQGESTLPEPDAGRKDPRFTVLGFKLKEI